jgi:glucokinase
MPPANNKPYIGVDLGGTKIQVGIVDPSDKILGRGRSKTKVEEGPEGVIKRIVKTVQEALDEAKLTLPQMGGLGIGAPGVIDMKTGVVVDATNLRWSKVPLGDLLSKELKLPVTVDNDVNVGTWAEYVAGAGKGYSDILGVFVGTGIGGGFVINGKLYAGHFMSAGEIGQTVLQPDAPRAYRRLETLASRTAIVNQLIALIKSNHKSKIVDLVDGDLTDIRSKAIDQAIDEKDPLTTDVVKRAAFYVGCSIANAVTLLSLPCVVMGGGVTEALGKPWMQWVRESFEMNVYPSHLKECKIVQSKFGDDAGLLGAAFLARDQAK